VAAQEIGRTHRLLSRRLHHVQAQPAVRGTEQQLIAAGLEGARRRTVGDGPSGAHTEAIAALELEVGADVRSQRTDDPLELRRRTRRLQVALLRRELLRVGCLRVILVGELEAAFGKQVEGADQQQAAELGEPC
jgi:hypothetical protein